MNKIKQLYILIALIFITCTANANFFDFASTEKAAILETLSDEKIDFKSLEGNWVLINYWASWCQPCVDEINVFNTLAQQNKNIKIFAVNYDAMQISKQKRLAKQFNIQYPSLKHNVANTLNLKEITVVPITFVFDPSGKLHDTLYDGQTLDSINEVLK